MEKWLSGLRQQLAKLSHNFICGMGSNPFFSVCLEKKAGMVELVDTSDLGPGGLGLVGSSPTARRLNF